MESADNPRWYGRPLFSINHLLAAILVAQIGWFVTQRTGWLGTAFPKGSTELTAIGLSIVALLLVATFIAIRWIFILFAWRSSQAMGQFQTRTMLLCVTVASMALAEFANAHLSSQRERAAAAALSRSGGSVEYSGGDPRRPRMLPRWLVNAMGPGFFFEAHYASANTDSDLVHVSQLKDVRDLHLDGTAARIVRIQFPAGRSDVTDNGLASLRELAHVRHVRLASPNVTNAGMEHLSQLKNLEILMLTSTQIDDRGLEQLGHLENLRWLTISGGRNDDAMFWRRLRPVVDATGAQALRKLQARHAFRYPQIGIDLQALGTGLADASEWGPPRARSSITDQGIVHLARLPQLQTLELQDSDVTGEGLRHFRDHGSINAITLSGSKMSDEGLRHAGSIRRLSRLSLDETPITDQGLAHLRSLSQLGWLTLYDTQVDGTGFSAWERSEALGGLDLGRTRVTDLTISNLRVFPKLTHLELDTTGITDAGLAPLAELKSLQELNLAGTKVTGEGLRHLGECVRLDKLDLSETPLDETQLVHLSELPRLQVLDLSFTPVTDAAMVHLSRLPALKRLNLVGTKVTRAGNAQFQKAMPRCAIEY
jgi:internalin A